MAIKKKKRLTKVERRLAVVKDAIKQIKLNKYVAEAGSVISARGELEEVINNETEAKEVLKKLLKKKDGAPICNVCARGALLVSTIHKENNFVLSDLNACDYSYGTDGVTDKRLQALFSGHQLALIEQAFEEGHQRFEECTSFEDDEVTDDIYTTYALNADYLSLKEIKKCEAFHDKYDNETDRLLAIFKNIVKNEGTFKP
jgi:hypothetical protein